MLPSLHCSSVEILWKGSGDSVGLLVLGLVRDVGLGLGERGLTKLACQEPSRVRFCDYRDVNKRVFNHGGITLQLMILDNTTCMLESTMILGEHKN